MILRRSSADVSEAFVRDAVFRKDNETAVAFIRSPRQRSQGIELDAAFKLENLGKGKPFYDDLFKLDLPKNVVWERSRLLARELQGMDFLSPSDVKLEELRGRMSGDRAWRLVRGELGNEKD